MVRLWLYGRTIGLMAKIFSFYVINPETSKLELGKRLASYKNPKILNSIRILNYQVLPIIIRKMSSAHVAKFSLEPRPLNDLKISYTSSQLLIQSYIVCCPYELFSSTLFHIVSKEMTCQSSSEQTLKAPGSIRSLDKQLIPRKPSSLSRSILG